MKKGITIMPSSAASNQSTSSSSNGGCSGGGSCQFCCELQHHHQHPTSVCQMVSCTPIDALPGYSTDHHHLHHPGDVFKNHQQFVALPPVPRERGRSRMNNQRANRPSKHPPRVNPTTTSNVEVPAAVFCSPVILSTSTPEAASSNSSMNGSLGQRWRPRRRRSASNRQRQDASIIRSQQQQQTNNSEMTTTTTNLASSQGFFALLS